MDIGQCIVHIPSEHFREPMINTRKHSEEGRHTHYQVEVSNDKVSIMHVHIYGRVTNPNTSQSAGNECAYKSNGKKHSRSKPEIPPPYCGEPVKYFNSR